jgi:hypothetical protein
MIRVLRLIEYTYETPERMADDLQRWTRSGRYGGPLGGMTFRSTNLDPQWDEDEDA